MDWIDIVNQTPPTKTNIWVRDAFGDAQLCKNVILVGGEKKYFHAIMIDNRRMRRCTKWATYDVIY